MTNTSFISKYVCGFSLCCISSFGGANLLPIDQSKLVVLSFDNLKRHEAVPIGVPLSYNWATGPRIGAGNNPRAFQAATGWGQVFYSRNLLDDAPIFSIRGFQTHLCVRGGSGPEWFQKQNGQIEGNQFKADFSANANVKPKFFREFQDSAEISFQPGSAYHFWPKSGRFDLPQAQICGMLVLLEAKQNSGPANSLLIGLGADYWSTKSAPWDNYKTNMDVAIGRLKLVSFDWQWFGLITASEDAFHSLVKYGQTKKIP